MRLQGVQLLLQLHQPAGRQVHVLQHHPPAGTAAATLQASGSNSRGLRLSETKPAYLPDFTAVLIALSAWLKPSAEPGARKLSVSKAGLGLKAHHEFRGASARIIHRAPLPIAIEVICVFCSAARSSTCPLASYPGTEHIRTGVLGLT